MKNLLVLALLVCVSAQSFAQEKMKSGFDKLDAQGIGAGYQPHQGAMQTPRFEYLNAQGKPMTQEEYNEWIRRIDALPTPPPPPKRELGPIDKWRFESCQQDAATAPTPQGVVIKMRLCRERFDQ